MPPWLQPALASLSELNAGGRLPHALLLVGDQLALTLASKLGQELLCHSSKRACGQCQQCQWVDAGSHPDLVLLKPESKSGLILIEQTRALARNATLTASGQRIFIISPADAMNRSAANSLLKTLEEPPANTIIILCSSRPGALPATILSRCQTIILPGPSLEPGPESLSDYLASIAQDCDASAIAHLIELTHGRVDDVLGLLGQDVTSADVSVSDDLADLRSSSVAIAELAARWIDSGYGEMKLKQLARLAQVRLKARVLGDDKDTVNSASGGLTNLWRLYDATNRCRALLKTSARSELQLEALLLMWRDSAA